MSLLKDKLKEDQPATLESCLCNHPKVTTSHPMDKMPGHMYVAVQPLKH
mgnify:CR=1 FL=1